MPRKFLSCFFRSFSSSREVIIEEILPKGTKNAFPWKKVLEQRPKGYLPADTEQVHSVDCPSITLWKIRWWRVAGHSHKSECGGRGSLSRYVVLTFCRHVLVINFCIVQAIIIIIHTQLIKLEDVATSNHMSLVELATITVKNRQSKKCRTTLMISDTSVELLRNKQVSSGHNN